MGDAGMGGEGDDEGGAAAPTGVVAARQGDIGEAVHHGKQALNG
jgi:hypothetical protein